MRQIPPGKRYARYTLRQDEALLARLVAFAEGPTLTSVTAQTSRLVHDLLDHGQMIVQTTPPLASWSPIKYASFQRTIQTFFRQLADMAESGNDDDVINVAESAKDDVIGVLVPELAAERLRFSVTPVGRQIVATVEGT